MRQFLSVVDFLHQSNFVHRAISPENILLVKTGEGFIIKLIDFSQAMAKDVPKPPPISKNKSLVLFRFI